MACKSRPVWVVPLGKLPAIRLTEGEESAVELEINKDPVMQSPDELLNVYSTSDPNEAEIIKAALHGEGIKCEISGESQAGLAGLSTLEIQLLVKAEDFDRARDFIEQHQRGD